MTTYYVLPALTAWASQGGSTPNGFSLTSGGAPVTVDPTYGDTVIFDNNSGPGRSIANPSQAWCSTLQISSANGFTLANVQVIVSASLNSNSTITFLSLSGAATGCFLAGNGSYIGTLAMSIGGGTYVALNGPLKAGSITSNGGSGTTPYVQTNGYAISATTLVANGVRWDWSTSSVTFTGTVATNAYYLDLSAAVSGTGTPTFIFDVTPSGYARISQIVGPTVDLVVAGTGGGYLSFDNANYSLNSLTIKGAYSDVSIYAGWSFYVNSLYVDGSGGMAKFRSTGQTTIRKLAPGATYFDRAILQSFVFTSDYGAGFYSRNDKGSSGCTNLNLVPGNSRFTSFF